MAFVTKKPLKLLMGIDTNSFGKKIIILSEYLPTFGSEVVPK
jgi:hypothetical protein